MRVKPSVPKRLLSILLLTMGAGILFGPPAVADQRKTPAAADFERLTPGKSSRAEVIRTLGKPVGEYNVYAGKGVVPVQLPKGTKRYGPRGEARELLRVLQYPGDEHREFYAAVLQNDILYYTFAPVPSNERRPEALRERYGKPRVFLNRAFHGDVLRTVEIFAYEEFGLAFINERGKDYFSAKVLHPISASPSTGVVLEFREPANVEGRGQSGARGDTTTGDTEGAFDDLFDKPEAQ